MTSGFDEQDLVRALTAPATAAELADEVTYRALFRAEGPTAVPGVATLRPGARRAVRRVGTASTLAVAFALAGAGVAAAAYSSHLPAPVQGAVHRVLGPIGVPAAEPVPPTAQAEADQAAPPQPEAPIAPAPTEPAADPTAEPSALPTADPTASAAPTPEATAMSTMTPGSTASPAATPTESLAAVPLPTESVVPSAAAASPTVPTPTPSPTSTPSELGTASPSASPSSSPSASASASPSVSPSVSPSGSPSVLADASATPPPAPAEVSFGAAVGHRVALGQTTVFSGVVSAADGSAVPGARVVLQEHAGTGWREVGEATTGKDGTVSLRSEPADRTVRYRIQVQDLRSAPWRLVLRPTLSATASTSGAVATVTVTAAGGRAGSTVLLMTRRDGQQVVVTSSSLSADGRVRFDVPAPTAQSWYAVRLLPSGAHAGASTRVLVEAGAPTVTPSP